MATSNPVIDALTPAVQQAGAAYTSLLNLYQQRNAQYFGLVGQVGALNATIAGLNKQIDLLKAICAPGIPNATPDEIKLFSQAVSDARANNQTITGIVTIPTVVEVPFAPEGTNIDK